MNAAVVATDAGRTTRAAAWAHAVAAVAPSSVAATATAAAVVLTVARAPGAVGAIGAVLTAGWLVVTVTAALGRRRRLGWTTAGVGVIQAAGVGVPALGPVVVVTWATVLLAVPDGRLTSTGRRFLAGVLAAGGIAWTGALAATGGSQAAAGTGALIGLAAGCAAATAVVGVAGSGRTDQQRRWALQWAAAGAVVALAVGGVAGALYLLVDTPARPVVPAFAGWLGLPLGLAAGLHRRTARLAPRALVEAVVVAGLAVLVCVVYLVVVIGLGREPVGGERDVLRLSLVAAFVTATLAWPVRIRLSDTAERAFRAAGPSPQELLATFSTRMTRAVPMDELLLQLTELLRATLGPAGAEVWTGTGGTLTRAVSVPELPPARLELAERERTVVASARAVGNIWLTMWMPGLVAGATDTRDDREARNGPQGGELVRVAPVTHLGELLGLLVVRRPAAGPPFTAQDDRILVELARQIGLALHNVTLDTALQASLAELRERNAELQASRARIVGAADASRRRIERDLHDGAQQHLVGLAVKLGLAEQIVSADPDSAVPMLAELRTDVRAATAALRELAHGIYPPLLRDHGLAAALRAAGSRSPQRCSVEVSVGRYPPDVEAAVYFCCLEALQNAGKHAGPDAQVQVRVEADAGKLRFSVTDDGPGFDAAAVGGHGFVNMDDRVGAIGGSIEVVTTPGAGTAVRGRVPVGGAAGRTATGSATVGR